ncbi:MAG: hypothetical protein LBJ64_08320 [Deltaproteobacteria bacterium]|nr:hypothetical protein [Deltaproteobacteria bacterium]
MKIALWATAACFALASFCPAAWAADEDGSVKSGVRSIVSGIVSTGKDALSGIGEGIDEGRREGESGDKASLVLNREDFEKYLSAEVIRAERSDGGSVLLTVAIKNDNEQPIRLANLSELQSLVLLDADGFSYPLPDRMTQGKDVTALGRSLTRLQLRYFGVEAEPVTLRLFDIELPVPAPAPDVAAVKK